MREVTDLFVLYCNNKRPLCEWSCFLLVIVARAVTFSAVGTANAFVALLFLVAYVNQC